MTSPTVTAEEIASIAMRDEDPNIALFMEEDGFRGIAVYSPDGESLQIFYAPSSGLMLGMAQKLMFTEFNGFMIPIGECGAVAAISEREFDKDNVEELVRATAYVFAIIFQPPELKPILDEIQAAYQELEARRQAAAAAVLQMKRAGGYPRGRAG